MVVNGWTLLAFDAFVEQYRKLTEARDRALRADPENFGSNANVRLRSALAKLALETIPGDPARQEYRQGNTLGPEYRHWLRAKFLGRFRLFFRYESRARIIVYAWVNDEGTLRQAGGRNDPYEVFRRMLRSGDPPNDWAALVKRSTPLSGEVPSALRDAPRRK